MAGAAWFMAGARPFGPRVGHGGLCTVMMSAERAFGIEQPTGSPNYAPGALLIRAVWQLTAAGVLLFRTPAPAALVCGPAPGRAGEPGGRDGDRPEPRA